MSIRSFIFLHTIAVDVCSLGCKDLKKYTMGPRCGGPDKFACPEGRRCNLDTGKCDAPNAYGVYVKLEDICDKKYKPFLDVTAGHSAMTATGYSPVCRRLTLARASIPTEG